MSLFAFTTEEIRALLDRHAICLVLGTRPVTEGTVFTMKAAHIEDIGPPDVIRYGELTLLEAADDEGTTSEAGLEATR
jgi:hypothetical protein